jgi:hypothetical protein
LIDDIIEKVGDTIAAANPNNEKIKGKDHE